MDDVFESAGTLREAYAAVDWAATPLGPVSSWSPTLTSTVRMALRTRFAVTLLWGPEYVLVYNEAYARVIGDKHPAALGAPARDIFPEIWDTVGPMLDQAATGRQATWVSDLRLLMDRYGYPEETFFTFSYSAVAGPDGAVEGVIDIASETTAQVIGNRRLALLYRLNERLADVDDRPALLDRALPVLRSVPDDLTDVTLTLAPDDPEPQAGAGPDGAVARIELGDGAGLFTARLSPYLPVDENYHGFLRLIGGTLTQALDRIQARETERLLASVERAMSEALQDSLLTRAAQPEHLRVAVRYHSSIAQAHIGGDWYDAFVVRDGLITLAVGDVTGHDRSAAAVMAQVRNLLRGIAYTVEWPPSRILSTLNDAMLGLGVDRFATVVLAQVQDRPGRRTFRWANAGHPPPVLLHPDGAAELLRRSPEILLGTPYAPVRVDHEVTLEPGAAVVLYTDGLIERRGAGFDESLRDLTDTLAGRGGLDAEQLCDLLLDRYGRSAEDDIALTVVR
ncbi:PP2C family protein-serine/threonine phosphatase [Catenuloplanes atrovinosus]|uniref:Serine phosphatase RsbU (Regulator of sigma subunit) n=1 Tax=Catenuloplanes atrovinosus TaxID=137266 RepID=A0AAE3YP16_9ACTN|nr:PP2C family protein-serine/threonine phosphatase [Catenuloplanes atrovinosus]MDR7277373.1 serine phosphatase RsbU (regulator of sigma subunit) [Catenuloplanes atrovinosus]